MKKPKVAKRPTVSKTTPKRAAARKPTRNKPANPAVDFDMIERPSSALAVTVADLDALEAEFGPFPPRYREFMTRFGAGEFRGIFAIGSPQQVRRTTADRRPWFAMHLVSTDATVRSPLWSNAHEVLKPSDVAKLVVLGWATAGDLATLAFVAGEPSRILRFERPSMSSEVFEVGPSFAHAIAKYFEPDD